MNDSTITAIGPACAALVVTALCISVSAADAAETVHMPMEGQTQGDDHRPAVQPDPIGKSARPDVAPGRARSDEARSGRRGRDAAPETTPTTTGIEHEDIGSAARASGKKKKKPRKGLTALGTNLKDKRSTSDDPGDTKPGASSATDGARAADDGEARRR